MRYGPRITTNGLILCIDGASKQSFPVYTSLNVTSGLRLWLDASDASTFTYSSGTSVSQWNDKSGNNFHVSQATVSSQPNRNTTQNSRSSVYFDGNDILNTSSNVLSSSSTDYTKIAVVYQTSRATTGNVISSNSATPYHAFYFAGSVSIRLWHSADFVTSNVGLNDNTLGIITGTFVNSSGTGTVYVNGTNGGSGTTANKTIGTDIAIGGLVGGSNFTGQICEVLVYNRVLTSAELYLVNEYLSYKWGVNNTDKIGFDLSGNTNNGALTNGVSLSTSNGGCMSFDGSNDCVVINSNASILPTSAYTKTAWFYPTSFVTANNIISGGNSGQHAFWLASGNKLNAGHNGSWSTVVSSTTLSLNTWYYGAVTFNTSTGWVLYLNGVSESTSASTTTFTGNGEILIGAFSTGNNVFTGRIACVGVYNRVLSASEILQNFNATRGRFGI